MSKTITVKTLPEATAQEVFDQVARHLLTQRAKSNLHGFGCLYRSDDGLRCAAGCLIADDEYKPEIEYKTWDQLTYLADNQPVFPMQHARLIRALQQIHDAWAVAEWRKRLAMVAISHGLSSAVLKEFADE